jgi:hypothetical protein
MAVWGAFFVVLSFTSADPDLWGHIRFGLDILRDGYVHHIDTYSFASDRPWVNHEWGAEVLSALAFRTGGNAGLVIMKLLLVCPILLLLNRALRLDGVRSPFARDLTAGAAILMTLSQAHHVRPQLFSLLLFATVLWCLLAVGRGSLRSLFVLPPVFAAWANLHGGWIVGGGVMALWTAALFVRGQYRPATACLAAGIVSLFATLMTPYGLTLWSFLHDTVGFGRPEILEWQPVYVTGWMFLALWLMALAIMVCGAWLDTRRDTAVERLVVGITLAIASFKVLRLIAFFGLASVFFFAPAICRAYERRRATCERQSRRALRVGFFAVGGAMTMMALGIVRTNFETLRLDTASMPEPQALTTLANQSGGRRVLVWFNWGEYAIWHLSPHLQVSIDGRRETVYSDRIETRHWDFFYDRPGGATLPDALAADYIWIPKILPAARKLRSDPHWTTLYEGPQSIVFARATVAGRIETTNRMASAADVVRSFPGP